jgi:hypothetical protein
MSTSASRQSVKTNAEYVIYTKLFLLLVMYSSTQYMLLYISKSILIYYFTNGTILQMEKPITMRCSAETDAESLHRRRPNLSGEPFHSRARASTRTPGTEGCFVFDAQG